MYDTHAPLAPRRDWFADDVRSYLRLSDANLASLAMDFNNTSRFEQQQARWSIAAEAARRELEDPLGFADVVVRLLDEKIARDAIEARHQYRVRLDGPFGTGAEVTTTDGDVAEGVAAFAFGVIATVVLTNALKD